MANYIQATLWDDTNTSHGTLTMAGSSVSVDFTCSDFFSIAGRAATAADLPPPAQGAISLLSLACSGIDGS